jgi:endoplasmic reticulum junction formation protein lunapark
MKLLIGRVYGMRRSVKWWYTRRIEREIQEKEDVKTRLNEKIEELKEKSDYYNTQQLLERYDPKSLPKSSGSERRRGHPNDPPLRYNVPEIENLGHQSQSLRQRGNPNLPLPPLPPPISPSAFASAPPPQPQNIPQFHPSAFSPPPSPTLVDQPHSKTFLDRVLDLLVGEDENAADHRYALICRHCRAHNGLAPPGERGDEVGYLCGRCGGWNGPDPKQKPPNKEDKITEESEDKEKQSVERSGHSNNSDGEIKVRNGQEDIGEKPQE